MSYGIKCINDHGRLQFSSDSPSYQVHSTGVVTTQNNNTYCGYATFTINVPLDTHAQLYIKPKLGYQIHGNIVSYTPGVMTIEILTRHPTGISYGVSVEYTICITADVLSPSTEQYGIRTFDGLGKLTYDSGIPSPVIKSYFKATRAVASTQLPITYAATEWVGCNCLTISSNIGPSSLLKIDFLSFVTAGVVSQVAEMAGSGNFLVNNGMAEHYFLTVVDIL